MYLPWQNFHYNITHCVVCNVHRRTCNAWWIPWHYNTSYPTSTKFWLFTYQYIYSVAVFLIVHNPKKMHFFRTLKYWTKTHNSQGANINFIVFHIFFSGTGILGSESAFNCMVIVPNSVLRLTNQALLHSHRCTNIYRWAVLENVSFTKTRFKRARERFKYVYVWVYENPPCNTLKFVFPVTP